MSRRRPSPAYALAGGLQFIVAAFKGDASSDARSEVACFEGYPMKD